MQEFTLLDIGLNINRQRRWLYTEQAEDKSVDYFHRCGLCYEINFGPMKPCPISEANHKCQTREPIPFNETMSLVREDTCHS